MTFTIINEPTTSQQWCDAYNKHTYLYTEDTQRLIRHTCNQFGSQLLIKDLSNAFKTGAECQGYLIDGEESDSIDFFIAECNHSVDAMLYACEQAMKEKPENSYNAKVEMQSCTVTIAERSSKGVRTFSPLPQALKTLKPLKEIPKKWTLRHVMRMLANQQYINLETRDRYTDDYAMDAAHNYYKGSLCGLSFLDDLTSSPSGWWISGTDKDGTQLGISCHHFDYKQCIVDLTGALRAEAQNTAQDADEQNTQATQAEDANDDQADTEAPVVAGILMGLDINKDHGFTLH